MDAVPGFEKAGFVVQWIRVVATSAAGVLLESKDVLFSKSYSFKLLANPKC